MTSNQLWHTHYSPYQSFLHNKIKQLKAEGLGYRKIAKRLNEENIKTSRGNAFYPSSVYSILKKKKIRDERLNKVFDKKISKLTLISNIKKSFPKIKGDNAVSVIKDLEKIMYSHAKDLEFEKAAKIRDQIESLQANFLDMPSQSISTDKKRRG